MCITCLKSSLQQAGKVLLVDFSDEKTETQKFRDSPEVIVSDSYCHITKHLKNSVTYNNKHVLVITSLQCSWEFLWSQLGILEHL